MCVAGIWHERQKGAIIDSPREGAKDGPRQPYPTPRLHRRGSHGALLPHRRRLRPSHNPHGARRYESIKRLADSEVIALALFQQLRGVESERSFLGDAEEILLAPVPRSRGALHPSSFHRRVRKLRPFLEPVRREVLSEMVGDPQTLLVDSTLLFGFASQAGFSQGSGFSLGQRG